MPLYLYRIINDRKPSEYIEVEQPIDQPPLTRHPATNEPVERVPSSPNLTLKHGDRQEKRTLDPKHLESAGFSLYEKDSSGKKYHRTVGKNGPKTFESQS